MTQTTIRARRVNNAEPRGKHYTLTRVINEGQERRFGFAISDDAETEIYIPAMVVAKEQMTEADIGAGFTCIVRASQSYSNENNHPHAILPIKWDGDAEEIPIDPASMEVVDEVPDLREDFQQLIDASDEVVMHKGPLDEVVQGINTVVASLTALRAKLEKLRPDLAKLDEVLNDVAPDRDE